MAYLFIQISDDTYVPNVLMKMPEAIRAQYAKRVYIVTKIANARQLPKVKR